jgi:hypothetical protein
MRNNEGKTDFPVFTKKGKTQENQLVRKEPDKSEKNRNRPKTVRGAGGETRTLTGFTPPDFESGASTNSAIPAWVGF